MRKLILNLVTAILLLHVFSQSGLASSSVNQFQAVNEVNSVESTKDNHANMNLVGDVHVVANGNCGCDEDGGNLIWTLDDQGILRISGNGEMDDYDQWPYAPWKSQEIQSVIIENGVTSIGRSAFRNCNELSHVQLSSTLETIGNSAFRACNKLSSIAIPKNIRSLEKDAFSECDNLEELEIPISVITSDAFTGCNNISKIRVVGSGKLHISDDADYYEVEPWNVTQLPVSVVICEGITEIGEDTFSYVRNLKNVSIPSSMRVIENAAFAGCSNLSALVLPENLEFIGDYAFASCSLIQSVVIPGSVMSIGEYAFSNCSALNRVSLLPGVTQVSSYSFLSCTSLENISVPATVNSIKYSAFDDCHGLTDVYYSGTQLQWNEIEMGGLNSNLTSARIHFQDNTDDINQSAGNSFVEYDSPMISRNRNKNNYEGWSEEIRSHLYMENDNYIRVECKDSTLYVEKYDSSFKFISGKKMELDDGFFWGGFFSGSKYNFLIIGQYNTEESNLKEVIRIIKFDKNWNRLESVGLFGANTINPFSCNSLRCAECSDILYVYTNHNMYLDRHGDSHQANLMIAVRQSDMIMTDAQYEDEPARYGYVSHSYNQFIIVDNNKNIITFDHGDGGVARSPYLQIYKGLGGEDVFSGKKLRESETNWARYKGTDAEISIIKFPGGSGNVNTGASLGGLVETSSGYLTAFSNSLGDQYSSVRNVFLAITSKDNFSLEGTTIRQVTNNDFDNGETASTPILVQKNMTEGKLLWNNPNIEHDEFFGAVDSVSFVSYFSDGTFSDIKSATGQLSDCQPIYYGNKIVWYVTNDSTPTFYILENDTINSVSTSTEGLYPVNVNYGSGSGEYKPGSSVTIIAQRPYSWSRFRSWNMHYLDWIVGNYNTNSASFIMPEEAVEVTAYFDTVEPGDPSSIETITIENLTVTASVICGDSNTLIFCGIYRNDGKMVSIRSEKITSSPVYKFKFDGQKFDYAKAFLVDSSFKPMCEAKRT